MNSHETTVAALSAAALTALITEIVRHVMTRQKQKVDIQAIEQKTHLDLQNVLRKEVMSLRSRVNELEEEISRLRDNNNTLMTELDQLSGRNRELVNENKRLTDVNKSLEDQFAHIRVMCTRHQEMLELIAKSINITLPISPSLE